jgi:hypothetical protein
MTDVRPRSTQCAGKVAYPSKGAAHRALGAGGFVRSHRRGRRKEGGRLGAYACPHCGFFHLGHARYAA